MTTPPSQFDLEAFMPFILNQAAEVTSQAFAPAYRERFDLSRTQWRVMAIAARHDRITARDICNLTHEEKSKVSRAIASLETRGLITRQGSLSDRRAEDLTLTPKGHALVDTLGKSALAFGETLRARLGPEKEARLRELLAALRDEMADL